MLNKKTRPISLISACLFSLLATFQLSSEPTAGFRLNTLSVKDGLPNTSVSAILQDKNEYLWFGTQGGLARYNGIDFKIFSQDPFDNNSLNHNLIQTMMLDTDGTIWIGTYNSLCHFDPVSERFTRYLHIEDNSTTLSNNVVTSIFRDSSGKLWVGTLNGLNLMKDDGTFTRFLPTQENPSSLPHKVVRAISEDSSGNIWVGTYGGISRFDDATQSFHTLSSKDEQGALPGDSVMTITRNTDKNILWFGLWSGGIVKLNTETGETVNIETPGFNIYTTQFDSEGNLWAGTWGQGILIIDPDTGSIQNYSSENSEDLANDIIYSLYEDNSGVLWIGTNGGGLNKYVKRHNRFNYYPNRSPEKDLLSKGKIYALTEDSRHRIWVGIYGSGVNRIEQDGSVVKYTHNPEDPASLSNNIINRILEDSRGNLWIATNNGFCLYQTETDDFKQIYNPFAPDDLSSNIFYRIFEDRDGLIWFGTYNSGLLVMDPETDSFTQYRSTEEEPESISDNLVRAIMQDSKGQIWIGTNSGLNLFRSESGTFRRFMHGEEGTLSSNDIRCLYENKDGKIWAGSTGGGISVYDPETEDFSYISRKDGLLSNNILDIKSADNGEIWITEQNGISIYMEEHNSFRNITSSSGLLEGDLTCPSLFTDDGSVFCGGTNGITVVPFSFTEENPYLPDIRIINIMINGQTFFNSDTPLKNGTINLKHYQKNINIELNSTDYSFPQQNRFVYKLEGFSPEWTSAGKRHYISYTNMPPGKYIFYARGSGSRNNWSEKTLQLKINIKPHPMLSNPAIIIYSLLVIAASIALISSFQRKKRRVQEEAEEARRRNRELELRVEERTAEIDEARRLAEEASGAKSLFLANMSHEIRTPLNGILGMLTLLEKTAEGSEQKQYIDYSQISAENLLLLLDDILDYEKLKSGKVKITEEDFNLPDIIEYIRSLFSESAAGKNIQIEIIFETMPPDSLMGDRRKLTQILSNLLSNAVKYTDSGMITLKIGGMRRDNIFTTQISVSDTGRGIPEEKLETIFDSFEQLDSSYTKTEKGVGLGLAIVDELVTLMHGNITVESTAGEGTEFTFRIPFRISDDIPKKQQRLRSSELVSSGKVKILIAEDEAINRLYITKLLKDAGYDFISCVNGQEACDRYSEFLPDIILMDIGMPIMNGMEAMIKIREMEKKLDRHALLIMLSAHVYKDDIELAKESGADDFLGKPFSEHDFLRSLRHWSEKID